MQNIETEKFLILNSNEKKGFKVKVDLKIDKQESEKPKNNFQHPYTVEYNNYYD